MKIVKTTIPCKECEAKGYIYNEYIIDTKNWKNPLTQKTDFRKCPTCKGTKIQEFFKRIHEEGDRTINDDLNDFFKEYEED